MRRFAKLVEDGQITGDDFGFEMLSLALQLRRKPLTKDVLGFLELLGSQDPLRNVDTFCLSFDGGRKKFCFFCTITFALVKQAECCWMVFIFYRTTVHTNDIFLRV